MKRLFKLPALAICVILLMNTGNAKAATSKEQKSGLVSTAWRMVKNLTDNNQPSRTMYFKKNFTFESLNSDGSLFNSGIYAIIDPNTIVTVHSGAESANLYHIFIKNDTLRLIGHFIDPRFPTSGNQIGFYNINEKWVRIKDWKDINYGIKFSDDSLLSTVLAESAKEGKMVFMDCYTTWCGPCKYMASTIFPQKEVGDFYNKNFVNVSFDMETPEGRNIAKRYGIRAYPTYLYLNSNGEVEHRGLGSGTAENFIKIGKTALDTLHNLRALKLKIKNGDISAGTIMGYLYTNPYCSDKDSLLKVYFKGKSMKQRVSENSWSLFNSFDNNVESPQFKYFAKHLKSFEKAIGKKKVEDKVWQLMNANMRDSVKYYTLRKLDKSLFEKHQLYMNYRIAFYRAQTNMTDTTCWKNLIKSAKLYFAQDSIKSYDYNNLCWYIYKNYKTFKDKNALKLAKDWSYKSHLLDKGSDAIDDTYAHILFDLGDVDGAIKYEGDAIQIGKKTHSSQLQFYTDELARYKKAKIKTNS